MFQVIRTLIVDDDVSFVHELKERLLSFPRIKVIAEANSACEAINFMKEKMPDLLFLNAEMPEKSGFDIVRIIKNQVVQRPFVIFLAKHSGFALPALRAGAIDYLCKPLNDAELQGAIGRVIEEITRTDQAHKIDYLSDFALRNKQVFFPSPTGFKSVNIQDIVFIRKNSETGKTDIIMGDQNDLIFPVSYRLMELMKILSCPDFFQIKREIIINLRYLLDVETQSRICILKKAKFLVKLPMSRRSLKDFKDQMVF